jgi:ABC-type antimicrobial peptide transport system permease subunit
LGTLIGIGAAILLTRFMASMLFGVRPVDPVTFVSAPLLMILVALCASFIPAHRAAKVDPGIALRYE